MLACCQCCVASTHVHQTPWLPPQEPPWQLSTSQIPPTTRRKHVLLSYFHSVRQQLLRLVSLVTWHPKSKALVECVDHGKVRGWG